jgi:hypothetical protein
MLEPVQASSANVNEATVLPRSEQVSRAGWLRAAVLGGAVGAHPPPRRGDSVTSARSWLPLLGYVCLPFLVAMLPPRVVYSQTCAGDCDSSGSVGVDELMVMVNIALGEAPLAGCAAADTNADGRVTVDEIVAAVSNALTGCMPQRVQLHAAVHFDSTREAINAQLIGTGGTSPFADANQLLNDTVSPPYMRLDVGFEDAGCPDNPNAGPLYDPTDNSFNYCRLDERLDGARASGSTPLLIIDYTPLALAEPACAATDGKGSGAQHCPPADYTKYGALVEAMIRHVYAAYEVTDFEVWNEPDWTFFAGTLADYLQLYETSNAAIMRAETALGLPERTLHLGGAANFFAHQSWVNALLTRAVSEPALRVDFISWHNYANNPVGQQPDPNLSPGAYFDDTQKVRGWIAPFAAQRPDLQPVLWIDEWNVNALFDARMDTSYATAFLAASLHAMQDARLDRAARFNTWDSTPASPEGFNGNWGFFTHDGQVRPALDAFAMWRHLAPTRVDVELFDDASRSRDASSRTRYAQNLIASIDAPSERATVLLYNFVAYSPLYAAAPYCIADPALDATLEFKGLPDGQYLLAQQQVDCSTPIVPVATKSFDATTSSLTVTNGSAVLAITQPADSVVLLVLTKQ